MDLRLDGNAEYPLRFVQQPYDPTRAEDALSLAAIFGVEHLSESEMQQAIELVEKSGLFREWRADRIPGPKLYEYTERPSVHVNKVG